MMFYHMLLSRRVGQPSGVVGVLLGGAIDDLVSPAEWWASSWAAVTVGWRPECRWLGCRVADGRCVRMHLGVACIFLLFIIY